MYVIYILYNNLTPPTLEVPAAVATVYLNSKKKPPLIISCLLAASQHCLGAKTPDYVTTSGQH